MPTLVAEKNGSDRSVPQADALIAEARARRRRRWLFGTLSAGLAAAAVATWLVRDARGGDASTPSATRNAQLAGATSCRSSMTYGPLPVWARAGFQPPDLPMPYVLGAHGDIVAVLWGRGDPLYSPPKPHRGNKVLWVSRLPLTTSGNLEIAARRVVAGTAVGPVVRRAVTGGPGPSLIDMPQAGCWQFTLRWSGHEDRLDLAYARPEREQRTGGHVGK